MAYKMEMITFFQIFLELEKNRDAFRKVFCISFVKHIEEGIAKC